MKRVRKKIKPKFPVGAIVTGKSVTGEPVQGKVIGTLDHSVIVEQEGVRHRCYDFTLEAVTASEQPTQKKSRKPQDPSAT